MKKYIIFGLVGLVVLLLVCLLIAILSNPLRRSEGRIRKDLLKLTPIGTSMEDVLAAIESYEKLDFYFTVNSRSPLPRPKEITSEFMEDFIRKKSMDFYLGKYNGFFTIYVGVRYSFDEDLNLIDIVVNKEMDLP
ncbi:MAG: hypothetical protein PHV32_01830 [Eubacteriales bacterium]|nr:hypothetical protein [Eubacteriales bacterium]